MNETGNIDGSCAIAVPAEPTSGKWQPIETAPKDIPVVVYIPVNRPERRVLVCDKTDQWDWGICGGSVLLGRPTHWMPIPEPPPPPRKATAPIGHYF